MMMMHYSSLMHHSHVAFAVSTNLDDKSLFITLTLSSLSHVTFQEDNEFREYEIRPAVSVYASS